MEVLTQLHDISADIFQAGIDLLLHKLRRDDENILHAERVLGSQSGSSC